MVDHRPRGLLGIDLGVLRDRRERPVRARARQPDDAGRGVVPGLQAVVRRAHLSRQARRRRCDRARVGDAAARRAALGRVARADGAHRRRPARERRHARRPRGRLHAEHPRDDRGVSRVRVDRSGVVELLARLRRAQRDRPVRADRAEDPARRRRLLLRRQGDRPERRRRGAAGRHADASSGPSCCRTSAPRATGTSCSSRAS